MPTFDDVNEFVEKQNQKKKTLRKQRFKQITLVFSSLGVSLLIYLGLCGLATLPNQSMPEEYSNITEPLRTQVCEYRNRELSEETRADEIFKLAFAVNYDKIEWFGKDWQFNRFLKREYPELTELVANEHHYSDYGEDEADAEDIFENVLRMGQEVQANLRKISYAAV